MLKPPRFTIVTVCFNAESTIAATAQSLLAQSNTDYEWLVIDGASKDGTLALIADLPLPNKRVISEPDHGIYDAMNKAVTSARGDWVYFLNCGDTLADDGVLADVSLAIDSQPDLQLLWGDMVYFDQYREWVRRFRHVNRRTLIFDDLNHQATFARRSLYEKVGHFNLDFRTSADYDWLIRVVRSGMRYKYLHRTIARFAVGGMHSTDPQSLIVERRRLRLQYLRPLQLRLGLIIARIRRRFRIIQGHGG